MTDQHIIPLIVVDGGVTIHDLGHDVAAHLGKGSAENDSYVSGKPSQARQELMNTPYFEKL